jgi:WD40 repeat protein
MCCVWAKVADCICFADSDHSLRQIRPSEPLATHALCSHKNTVWGLDVSLFHTFLASVSSDGTARVINMSLMRHRSYKPIAVTLYALSHEASTNTYSMVDDLPLEVPCTVTVENLVFYVELTIYFRKTGMCFVRHEERSRSCFEK